MERARRTTLPTRDNKETRVPGVTPDEVQQPSSGRPITTSDRNVSPSPHTNEVPQNKAASGDRPWPRPTLGRRPCSPSPAEVDRAMVPRPVGRERWTAPPAWMHARTIGVLQLQALSVARQERDRASATVRSCPSLVPPAVECESMNAATQGPGVASSGPQQVTSGRSLPMTGGNAPPSPRIIGNRRDRVASCNWPSPRPTTRSRHRSPSPCGGNIIITPASLLPGIIWRRQWFGSLPQAHRCALTSGFGSLLSKIHRTRGPWCL